MKLAVAKLEGISPYSQSRFHNTDKLNKELPNDYEKRTWRNKMHFDEDGMIYIPPLAFKNCLSEAAKFLSMQIPGKGKSTYTKHFEAGVLVTDPVPLGIHKDEVEGTWLHVPADGVRGSGKRVEKCFPYVKPGWEAEVAFQIWDDVITRDVFELHLKQAGALIGIGTFRVRNNGTYGRFRLVSLDWQEVELEQVA